MNEQQTLLADMAERLFKDLMAKRPEQIDSVDRNCSPSAGPRWRKAGYRC